MCNPLRWCVLVCVCALPETAWADPPATCSPGAGHYDISPGVVSLYVCTAPNTWTLLNAAGGSVTWADVSGKPTTFPPVIGAGAGDAVAGNDSRLTDARTPTAHAATHVTGSTDVIASVVAGGNAGLMTGADKTKLNGIATGAEVNVNADWNSGSGDSQILNKPATFAPSAHAVTHRSGGSDAIAIDTLAAPTDITTLNASTSAHGLLPKLNNNASQFLNGQGAWATPAGGGGGATYVVLTADRTNATTSYADITDLSFAVSAATRYDIECLFQYNANATTTGIGIGWTGPASPTFTTGQMISGLTGATIGGTTIVGNDTGAVTTASVATTGNSATFHGVWSNGANAGTLQMRFKSEVAIAAAIIIKAGSFCKYSTY